MRNFVHQILAIIAILEDTKVTQEDIYITYIDDKNMFGSIDLLMY